MPWRCACSIYYGVPEVPISSSHPISPLQRAGADPWYIGAGWALSDCRCQIAEIPEEGSIPVKLPAGNFRGKWPLLLRLPDACGWGKQGVNITVL